jgi:hypothetical protein
MESSVSVPYKPGSRVPNRFRFGPFNTRMSQGSSGARSFDIFKALNLV